MRKHFFVYFFAISIFLLCLLLCACGDGGMLAMCQHTSVDTVIENNILPTCTEEGSYDEVVYCLECEIKLSSNRKTIEKAPHDEITHSAKTPTCTETGWDAYVTCSRCDYSTYNEKAALSHNEITHSAKAPTCTETGWDAYVTCSRCDYSTYNEKAALSHNEITHSAKAPTCTETGWDAYVTCSRCDYSTYNEKSALSHNEITHSAKAPTCTETGWDAYVTCSRCDYSTYNEKSALSHNEITHSAKAPTCTETGWDAYVTCSRCDYSTYNEKAALSHNEITHSAKAPTCTETGWDAYVTCSRCDYSTYNEKAALSHNEITHSAKAPTCTETGWDAYVTCSRCDYSTYNEKAALNHNEITHSAKVPTCTELGWDAYVTCSRCDYSTRKTKALIEHTLSNNECTVCHLKLSAGLEYSLNSDGTTYTVTGIGSCTDENIVIGNYDGLKVTAIGEKAFCDLKNIKSVTILEGVTDIKKYAFLDCDLLSELTLPSTLASVEYMAFGYCENIEYNESDGVYYLGNKSEPQLVLVKPASTSESAYTIHPDTKIIAPCAFEFCGNLINITLPDKITYIGERAFYVCGRLSEISFPNSVYYIGDSALGDCYSITDICIGAGVSHIGKDAFYNCRALVCIEVSPSNTCYSTISGSLYTKDHETLIKYASGRPDTYFSIPYSVTTIADNAFSVSNNIQQIYLNGRITHIGNEAFSYCYSLVSINIPDSVISIGDFAFDRCRSLTSIFIPPSVTHIGKAPFYVINNFSSFSVSEENSTYKYENGILCTKDGTELIQYINCRDVTPTLTIPDGIISIGDYAFYQCNSIVSVIIPDSVLSIGDLAFYGCENLCSVTLGSGINSLGNQSIDYCKKLVEVINNSEYLENHWNFDNLTRYAIEVHNGDSNLCVIDGYAFYTYNGVNYLVNYTGNDIILSLPESCNGESYEIYKNAFIGNSNIVSVTIPEKVTAIGEDAFYYCEKLVEVINHSSINIICGSEEHGNVALYAKKVHNGETEIKSYSDYLFYTHNGTHYLIGYTGSDKYLTLPSDYSGNSYEIYTRAFDCLDIRSVYISSGVTSIGYAAFSSCGNLKSVTIGPNVTYIGTSAFNMCYGLETITIPDSVTHIEGTAFWFCTTLKSVTIGKNVSYIGKYIFESCRTLTSVTFRDASNWYTADAEIDDSELRDPTIAAKHLLSKYSGVVLTKKQ